MSSKTWSTGIKATNERDRVDKFIDEFGKGRLGDSLPDRYLGYSYLGSILASR